MSSGLDAIELDDGEVAGSGSPPDATPPDLQAWPGMMADTVNVRRRSPALTCRCSLRLLVLKSADLPSNQLAQSWTTGSSLTWYESIALPRVLPSRNVNIVVVVAVAGGCPGGSIDNSKRARTVQLLSECFHIWASCHQTIETPIRRLPLFSLLAT